MLSGGSTLFLGILCFKPIDKIDHASSSENKACRGLTYETAVAGSIRDIV